MYYLPTRRKQNINREMRTRQSVRSMQRRFSLRIEPYVATLPFKSSKGLSAKHRVEVEYFSKITHHKDSVDFMNYVGVQKSQSIQSEGGNRHAALV